MTGGKNGTQPERLRAASPGVFRERATWVRVSSNPVDGFSGQVPLRALPRVLNCRILAQYGYQLHANI